MATMKRFLDTSEITEVTNILAALNSNPVLLSAPLDGSLTLVDSNGENMAEFAFDRDAAEWVVRVIDYEDNA